LNVTDDHSNGPVFVNVIFIFFVSAFAFCFFQFPLLPDVFFNPFEGVALSKI
jgi:hypothetical protein